MALPILFSSVKQCQRELSQWTPSHHEPLRTKHEVNPFRLLPATSGKAPATFVHIRLRLRLGLSTRLVAIRTNNSPRGPHQRIRTIVESLQFIAGRFGIVHAIQHGPNTGIFLTPEIICD